MNTRTQIRASILSAALAALAVPAFAGEVMEIYTAPASNDAYYVAPRTDYAYVAPRAEYTYVAPTTEYTYIAPTTDSTYVVPDATTYYVAPSGTYYYTAPPITVVAPRDVDAAITKDVADNIFDDAWIHGAVGIDTWKNDVTLTGRVATPGQSMRAENDARRVDGVDEVRNHLRSSVGDY